MDTTFSVTQHRGNANSLECVAHIIIDSEFPSCCKSEHALSWGSRSRWRLSGLDNDITRITLHFNHFPTCRTFSPSNDVIAPPPVVLLDYNMTIIVK